MRGTRSPIQPSPVLTVRGPLHTRRCGGTLSKQERAGAPHPARAAPGPPSPWGKAAYRRGIRWKRGRLPCVKGAVSRRLTEGSPCCRLGSAPHPSGLRPATLSQERVWALIRPGRRLWAAGQFSQPDHGQGGIVLSAGVGFQKLLCQFSRGPDPVPQGHGVSEGHAVAGHDQRLPSAEG